jgi:deoxyxylulose-5-phosphate synthase
MQIVSAKDGMLFQILTEAICPEDGKAMVVYQELKEPFSVFVLEKLKFQKLLEKKEQTVSKQQEMTVQLEENYKNTPSLIEEFLDAENYNKKIEILESVEEQIEEDTLELLALTMDEVLEGDSVDAKYYSLIQVLRTRARFDIER